MESTMIIVGWQGYGYRNEEKELLTFRRPPVGRDLQQDALPSTASL